MTNFTKKSQAQAKINIGKSQARISRTKKGPGRTIGKKSTRKAKLMIGKAAAKNLIEGTMEKNKLQNQNTDSNN